MNQRPRSRRLASLVLPIPILLSGCSSAVEIVVETPLQSKIDVTRFRRVLVAGFVSELGESDIEVGPETARLVQNQLRSKTAMQIVEPDHPPIHDALEPLLEELGEGNAYTKQEKERYTLEAERVLQDAGFWRKVGEEFQDPLIITGRVGFEPQSRSGFQSDERVVRDPATNRPRLLRRSLYIEQKGYSLLADFHFVDGRTGRTLHRERFTEEVLYADETKTTPLSSYFELMDRLIPNFLGVISPQRIRGTRVLLR